MESVGIWQYNTLVDELTQGMEKTMQLRLHLWSTSPSEAQDLMLQKILSSYDKALLILGWGGSNGETLTTPETSVSVHGSQRSEDLNKNINDNQDYMNASKRRKMQHTWTEKVKADSKNGLEGPTDDGYSWRKYGQKYILGAKYPRSYYRCTYRLVQNCWATKQVQRSDDDLTVFDIIYKGKHTCNQCCTNTVPPPASPEKQKLKLIDGQNLQGQQKQALSLSASTEEMPALFSFQSTFAFHDEENQYLPISTLLDYKHQQGDTISPQLISPATSGSNYFTAATNVRNPNVQHSEADTADIISAPASTTNSPIQGMEFLIDPINLDPNFAFNMPEFFTYSNFEHGQ
ncbi:putative WRKY transcription factor 53-like [Dorcoceras hygrometricum]|uniref:Putative WRKY transcription factor 53-like n=1 Tax=Dorcoceras hygrometricum TaxID=472368 RepID=A0A2Z7BKS4_9LAMI|nr:putative WRKY transcription factor 53-like [Dorcoceras hygrometricum]